jgi:hypothetical protein
MAAAKIEVSGVKTCSSVVMLMVSNAGEGIATGVVAVADARRDDRASQKIEGLSNEGREWFVQMGGEKSAQCEIAPSVNTSECRQCGCCAKRSLVVAAADAACCTEGLFGAGRLLGSFDAKNPAFHLAVVAFLI